ncbi:MAG: 4Fe-4S binding protein [Anaerovoracaceae bacterium]
MPQVRIIDVMLVRPGCFSAQQRERFLPACQPGSVAVVGMNKVIRWCASAEKPKLTEQKKWIDRIFSENPSMNDVYPGDIRYILEPFCIESGEIEFFDLGVSPIFRRKFSMDKSQKCGFHITESCIGCGKCLKLCPQKCIERGTPCRIKQEHCLHCGLCAKNCPFHRHSYSPRSGAGRPDQRVSKKFQACHGLSKLCLHHTVHLTAGISHTLFRHR